MIGLPATVIASGADPNTASLDLDQGSSQAAYVTNADKTNINVPGDKLTLEFWLKFVVHVGTQVFAGVFDFAANEESFAAYYALSAGDQMRFRLENAAGAQDYVQWSLTPTAGVWEHWAFVWDGALTVATGSMKLYKNGVDQGAPAQLTVNNITALKNSTSPWVVGAFGDSGAQEPGSDFYDGQIDEMRLWHTARTQPEIADNMSKQLSGAEPGLVAYYRYNGDLLDRTANANDATPFNGPLVFPADVPFP